MKNDRPDDTSSAAQETAPATPQQPQLPPGLGRGRMGHDLGMTTRASRDAPLRALSSLPCKSS